MQKKILNYLQFFFKTIFSIIILFVTYKALAGTIVVSNPLSNSVSLFNDLTFMPISKIKVGFMPHEVAVTADGKFALVTNFGDLLNIFPGNSISVIDITHSKITKTVELPKNSQPHGIALISPTQALVTAEGIQSLLLIDFISGNIKKKINLPGAGAHSVIVSHSKKFAYVANTASGSITKIDLMHAAMTEVKIGKSADGLALINNDELLLVTDRKRNHIVVIRTEDLSVLKNIQGDSGPTRIVTFNNKKLAAILNSITGIIQVLDTKTLDITYSFKTSSSLLSIPVNLFINNDERTAYITHFLASEISLVDLKNAKILKTFKTDLLPNGVNYSPVNAIKSEEISWEMFTSGVLEIHANIEKVWKLVKDLDHYNKFSRGAVTVHCHGKVLPGNRIVLELYKDKVIGKFIPKSTEVISIVDDKNKLLAWIRELPGGYTDRYQILEKISDNETRSYIMLQIPGLIGKITQLTLGKTINSALKDLNMGIKEEAEMR